MSAQRSLRVSASFRDFVLDQLSHMRDLRAQAMFGGVGLYAGDLFFGILAADTLYLKVDDTTRHDYEVAGSSPFKPYAHRSMTMAYYGVPLEVLEDAAMLGEWAARAVAIARQSKPSKRAPNRRRGKRTTHGTSRRSQPS